MKHLIWLFPLCLTAQYVSNPLITVIPTTNSSGSPSAVGQLVFRDLNVGPNTVTLTAPNSISSSYTLKLPTATGTIGDAIGLTSTNQLGWISVPTSVCPGSTSVSQILYNNGSGGCGGNGNLEWVSPDLYAPEFYSTATSGTAFSNDTGTFIVSYTGAILGYNLAVSTSVVANNALLDYITLTSTGGNVELTVPSSSFTNQTYILPTNYPSGSNYFLTSTTGGTMSWATPPGSCTVTSGYVLYSNGTTCTGSSSFTWNGSYVEATEFVGSNTGSSYTFVNSSSNAYINGNGVINGQYFYDNGTQIIDNLRNASFLTISAGSSSNFGVNSSGTADAPQFISTNTSGSTNSFENSNLTFYVTGAGYEVAEGITSVTSIVSITGSGSEAFGTAIAGTLIYGNGTFETPQAYISTYAGVALLLSGSGATIQINSSAASSGLNYACFNTSGQLVSQAAAC